MKTPTVEELAKMLFAEFHGEHAVSQSIYATSIYRKDWEKVAAVAIAALVPKEETPLSAVIDAIRDCITALDRIAPRPTKPLRSESAIRSDMHNAIGTINELETILQLTKELTEAKAKA